MNKTTEKVYGHVPLSRECRACRLRPEEGGKLPLEACPEQRAAKQLVALGYVALPSSQEELDGWIEEAKRL